VLKEKKKWKKKKKKKKSSKDIDMFERYISCGWACENGFHSLVLFLFLLLRQMEKLTTRKRYNYNYQSHVKQERLKIYKLKYLYIKKIK